MTDSDWSVGVAGDLAPGGGPGAGLAPLAWGGDALPGRGGGGIRPRAWSGQTPGLTSYDTLRGQSGFHDT